MSESRDQLRANLCLPKAGGLRPSKYGLVSEHVVELAIRLIDDSGVVELLDQWKAEDQEAGHIGKGGRPSVLTMRAVLVLLVIHTLESSPFLVTRLADTADRRLSDEAREKLGFGSATVSYDMVWRRLHTILDLIDAFPINAAHGGNRRRFLTKDEFAAVEAARDSDEQKRKLARTNQFSSALLYATYMMLPRSIRRRWKGNTSIDATLVRAFGNRGWSRRSEYEPIEPDAGWYKREGNHGVDHNDPISWSSRSAFGFEAHIAIMCLNTDGNQDYPLLALAMTFDKPGKRVAENALAIYRELLRLAMPRGLIISDRAYSPGSKPWKFQIPIREMGYDTCNDYAKNTLGITDHAHGAVLVEGAWYCPAMPQHLVDATHDRERGLISDAEWYTRIEAREPYLMKAKERREDGSIRYTCPAEAGTARCPLKPESIAAPGPPLIDHPPEVPDRACTQRSFTIRRSEGAKYRQSLRYGTPEWARVYKAARSSIEGFNGLLKSHSGPALDSAGRRRVRGRTAANIFTAFAIVAVNVQKLRDFADQGTAIEAPKRRRKTWRERRAGREQHAPTTGRSPPQAA